MPGGMLVRDWFGYIPDFHDAELTAVDLQASTASLTIKAFHMTNKVDANGYYILNRHATVRLTLAGVTSALVPSVLPNTLLELGVRSVSEGAESLIELGFDDVMGDYGSIFAKKMEIDLVPAIEPPVGQTS